MPGACTNGLRRTLVPPTGVAATLSGRIAGHILLAFASLISLLALGCGGVQRSQPLDPDYGRASRVDSAQRASSGGLYVAHVAEIAGLPALRTSRLPVGHREIRLRLGCDLCLPEYLVRIVREPEGSRRAVDGDVLVLFKLTWEERDPDERREIEAHWRSYADSLARRVGCGEWRAGTFVGHVYHWCLGAERPEREWRALLDRLNALGVLELGAETGYSPTPPTTQPIEPVVSDSAERTVLPERRCKDIGGQHLLIEVLDGASFRQALLWCLEAPLDDEHRRAAEALETLKRFVDGEAVGCHGEGE